MTPNQVLDQALEGYKTTIKSLLDVAFPEPTAAEWAKYTPKQREQHKRLVAGHEKMKADARKFLAEVEEQE